MLAFTARWLLLLPLRGPKAGSSFEEAAWLKMPPPPPCALLGVVITPFMEPSWPEIVQPDAPNAALASCRAELEGIPEDAAEYAEALTDVRICVSKAQAAPMDLIKYWAFPLP